ncbi:MAG TPA: DUF1259 domain-containing protein [Gemmatimonadaceae bacterium]|nr:DUF1259 domain-containing protein [Gemmatimonadaceae bacterium]
MSVPQNVTGPLARVAIVAAFLAASSTAASAQTPPVDSTGREVARILQTPAVATGGYLRFNFPRRDITLRMGDVTVAPALALGGWAGFAGTRKDAVVMGDLVVTSDELKPVLAELERQRLDVTSIHNHLAGEQPSVTYIHFHGMGDAIDLATRLDRAVARTAVPRPVATPAAAPLSVDTARVFAALGASGRAQGSVVQLSFMLVNGAVTMHGRPLVPALAYGSPVNLQMVNAARAVATGDFAVLEAQVAPVVNALARHGITATAVHSHLVGETPRVYYIHFWADGGLDEVMRGLRAAVDAAR